MTGNRVDRRVIDIITGLLAKEERRRLYLQLKDEFEEKPDKARNGTRPCDDCACGDEARRTCKA